MAVVALALYVGLTESHLTKELTMLVFGIALFLVGRLLERSNGRS